jgi:hypothetical protein
MSRLAPFVARRRRSIRQLREHYISSHVGPALGVGLDLPRCASAPTAGHARRLRALGSPGRPASTCRGM